jgi:hypothetical protein
LRGPTHRVRACTRVGVPATATCSLDLMAAACSDGHDGRMPVMTPPLSRVPVDLDRAPEGGRDPAHAAYDHAAAMLASAQALEAAAHAPGAVPAIAPMLACLEASLEALALSLDSLRSNALERLSDPILPGEDLRAYRADIAADFGRLAAALDHGAGLCAQARRSLAPVSRELSAI